MAMANLPTYNVSEYDNVSDISLFNNAVVSVPYEPGSVIKSFTMATGIDKGVVSPTATYINKDSVTIDGRVIFNYDLGLDGVTTTFQEALNLSHNVGFVTVAKRLGDGEKITDKARKTIYEYFYDKFGLGKITGVELSNEIEGTIIPPDKNEGSAIRYANMAFGQGMDITMVQVASAFCSLVNGGKYFKPTVLAGLINDKGKFVKNDTISPSTPILKSTADQIREMLHTTRTFLFGYRDKPGFYIGGKTGTSDVLINGVYSAEESIGTYLGYGGSESLTKYVIMIKVFGENKTMNGAIDAQPIFSDMSSYMIDYLRIKPKE